MVTEYEYYYKPEETYIASCSGNSALIWKLQELETLVNSVQTF